DHRRRHAARRRPSLRRRIFVLARHADDGRAFAYDLYKSHGQMSSGNAMLIAVGFAVSFVCAWIVVKTFLGYVQRHGFSLFAWWRVMVGTLGLIALAVGY